MTASLARRRRAVLAVVVLAGMLAGCTTLPAAGARALPRTRAERTNYAETSRYADVIEFLDLLKARGAPFEFGSIGASVEGRDIPYVIASRPMVRTPVEARQSGKPIVYVQGNIHAGEVEGKEALQALLRELAFSARPSILDSIVLIAVPIYNADGNERVGPQERQRGSQNGPELVGQRPNAQGLDLNRDYIKADAPETRASLAMFERWDPDVFVDLHTTNGSFHGYALTYSPSLNPAAPLGEYTRQLLSELRLRMRVREGYETFDYGNFSNASGSEARTDTIHDGWVTYDHRPRFGTNYYGLRNRVSVLSEAYSHDSFERRVRSTHAFVRQLLSLVAERGPELRARIAAASSRLRTDTVVLRSALPTRALTQPVVYEVLARTGDSMRTQPGVPRGLRRTGELRTKTMPVFDRFVPTLERPAAAYYVVSGLDTLTLARLRLHGFRLDPFRTDQSALQRFVVDSVTRAARPFQGHVEARIFGRWMNASGPAVREPIQVSAAGRSRLLSYLLDPESDDGFATWDLFASRLSAGTYPVLRARTESASPN